MIIITYNNFTILVIMGLKMNQRNSEKSGGSPGWAVTWECWRGKTTRQAFCSANCKMISVMHEGRISASHGLLASDAFFPREQQNFIPKDSSESGVFSQHSPPQILHPPPPQFPPNCLSTGSSHWEKGAALSFTFRGQERKKGTLSGTSLGSWDGWSRSMGLDSQPHLLITGHLFPEVTMDLWVHGPLFLEFRSFWQ